ncbi:helix-turn-helix domain-containing protein [Nocardia sp. IFM 10818]
MPVEQVHIAGAAVDIAVPPRSGRMAGVDMAGFTGRTDAAVDLRMVPYPALTVFLDFGDVLLVDANDGARHRGSAVVGLGAGSVHGRGREVDLLQVRLSPVVAYGVLGGAPGLGGTVVALEELWGSDAGRIMAELHARGSWDERFAIAADALIRRYAAGRRADPEVDFAWRRIVMSRGRIRVERLAAETGWSRKRLWSRFRSQIGLTPKRAAQLVRFDCAAHRLAAGHSAALVSAECGFVDQSHLCRDAMAFAGLTPAGLAAAPWLAVDPVAWADPAYAPRM